MGALILGLAIFFAAHSVSIVNREFRNRAIAKLGEMPWKGVYSLISLVGFVLIVWGYGAARAEPILLYMPPLWLRYVALVLLLPVFPLLIAAYLPSRISVVAKHPMLLAAKLWAVAHLLTNGMLADVLLFGAFLAWAVADRIAVKRREPATEAAAPSSPANDIIVSVAGVAVYLAFVLWLHAWLFGVAPAVW
ncbi:MAG: NnrU family protein [Gammaproteobacteria bacterium]|nr:NnrU family protein [Gammaproteobacteria bacterium]